MRCDATSGDGAFCRLGDFPPTGRLTIQMARCLGLRTVPEGVEIASFFAVGSATSATATRLLQRTSADRGVFLFCPLLKANSSRLS